MKRVRVRLRGAVEGWYEVTAAEPLLFGRVPEARARLEDRRCSRVHCRIEIGPRGLEVVDLGSRNGTWLDERPVTRAALPRRCRLRLGDSVIEVQAHEMDDRVGGRPGLLCTCCGKDLSAETLDGREDPAARRLCGACAHAAAQQAPALEPALQARVERAGFTDLRVLEADGAAVRLRGRRQPLGQVVRLVLLRVRAGARLAALQRARRAAQLVHPAIMRLVDAQPVGEWLAFAYEDVEGASLERTLQRTGGRLELARALAVALAVAGALAHAHDRGVIHGSLDPSQVLLGPAGEVQVTGFGTPWIEQREGVRPGPRTLPYAAPEVAERGCSPDPRSDVHAFGAIVFHMLAGRAPYASFAGPGGGAAPALGALVEGLPPSLLELVDRCLDPTPSARPASAAAVRAALEAELRGYYGVLSADADLLARIAASAEPRVGSAFEDTTHHVRNFRADGGVTRFGGRFRGDELCELLQMLELNDKSGRVSVIDPRGEVGEIVLRHGRVIDARYGARSGREAVLELLGLEQGHFGVVLGPVADLVTSRGFALGPLLLEAAMRRGEDLDLQPGVA